MNASEISELKRDFKNRSDENLREVLEGKDKKNTQKETHGALSQFSQYLRAKSLPKLEDISIEDLPDILYNFYPSVKLLISDNYSIQTLKCLRSGLNRYFTKEMGIDITKDRPFIKANEMFQAVLIESKKQDLSVRKSYPPITQIDLEQISIFCT